MNINSITTDNIITHLLRGDSSLFNFNLVLFEGYPFMHEYAILESSSANILYDMLHDMEYQYLIPFNTITFPNTHISQGIIQIG